MRVQHLINGLVIITGICVITLTFAGCAAHKNEPANEAIFEIDAINGSLALAEVSDFVALGPRVAGTDGAEKAAGYLAEKISDLGYKPVIEIFTDTTPEGRKTFRNVMAVSKGTHNKTIILMSHYDTKAGISQDFAGANDSGSSTGLLLELLRVISQADKKRPDIVFAFVDGEECMKSYSSIDGLHGSRHLAQSIVTNQRTKNIKAVIVLDMIGDKDLTVTIPRNSTSELITLLFNAAEDEGVRDRFFLSKGAIIDDHVPFLKAGIPAVNIIDFWFGSRLRSNDYWHTEEDSMDKLSANSLEIVGKVTLRLINSLCEAQP